jgi:hypothetical protein
MVYSGIGVFWIADLEWNQLNIATRATRDFVYVLVDHHRPYFLGEKIVEFVER